MNICVVTYRYPSKYNDADFVFVKKLVDEFARQGNNCAVISPFSVLHYKGFIDSYNEYSIGNGSVKEYRPNYLSAGMHKICGINITHYLHQKAINKAFYMMERSGFKPDVVYCHFWGSGLLAYPYAKKRNLPLYVASGESTIKETNLDGHIDDFCDYVKGVICVSSKNKEESVTRKLTIPEKCIVAPNAINEAVFHTMDKAECRLKLNLPQNEFIIIFVGWFIDRKGPMRVSEAINEIKTNDVFSLFIGSGEQDPNCKNILFKGRVDNSKLPLYLNSADVFVLPTLHEGCCNAIIEAMACGLPIISSDLPFNKDILNNYNSIMIEPNTITDIKNAIVQLKNNDNLRESMSIAAIESATGFSIDKRANAIIQFFQNRNPSCL